MIRHRESSTLEQGSARMEQALIQAQQAMERHLASLNGAMREAARQLGDVTEVQAAVNKRLENLAGYDRLAAALAVSQQTLERNLGGLGELLRTSTTQIDQVAAAQAQLGRRVTELAEYERQYRDFLTVKRTAALPENLRGDS